MHRFTYVALGFISALLFIALACDKKSNTASAEPTATPSGSSNHSTASRKFTVWIQEKAKARTVKTENAVLTLQGIRSFSSDQQTTFWVDIQGNRYNADDVKVLVAAMDKAQHVKFNSKSSPIVDRYGYVEFSGGPMNTIATTTDDKWLFDYLVRVPEALDALRSALDDVEQLRKAPPSFEFQ